MKKMMINILLLVTASVAIAQNANQQLLINQNKRPSITEVLSDKLNYEPYTTLDVRYVDGNARSRPDYIKQYLPQMIVSLEKAFPGGTYAFLGRDMDLIADAVETYYHSIGQYNRVKKIEFSTPSLRGSSPELITKFLSQLGLETNQDKEKGAFVIIDFTSYSTRGRNDGSYPSQARHIYQSVIENLKQKGFSYEEIVSRLNLATLDNASQNNIKIYNPLIDSYADYFTSQAKSLDSAGAVDRITFLPAGGSDMAYFSEWNDKYGPIKINADGKLVTEPSSFFNYNVKNGVYSYIVQVINSVLSKDMSDHVLKLAAENGVTFSYVSQKNILQVKKLKPIKIDYEAKFKAEIKETLSNLRDLPTEKQYDKVRVDNSSLKLTENGSKVVQILSNKSAVQSEHYFEISFETLVNLYLNNKIGARDFRRIFAHILTLKSIDNSGFVSMVMNNYKRVLPLEIMFGRDEERQKYLVQGGVGEANYKSLIQNGQLKLSCRFSYSN